MSERPQPKVHLDNWTPNPVETLFTIEKFAKTDDWNPILHDTVRIAWIREYVNRFRDKVEGPGSAVPSDSVYDMHFGSLRDDLDKAYPKFRDLPGREAWETYVEEVESWALMVTRMGIPCAEQISFNLRFSNVSVAWREQLVRHRQNSHWVQSGRVMDYSTFAQRRAYNNPFLGQNDIEFSQPISISIDDMGDECVRASELFDVMMATEEYAYAKLLENGAREQDARELVGLGIHHRLTSKIDLRSLIQMLKTRSCFLLSPFWLPISMGIVNELVTKVDPMLEVLGNPPCLDHKKKFIGCKYEGMAQERYDGDTAKGLAVCPMWYSRQAQLHRRDLERGVKTPIGFTNPAFSSPQHPPKALIGKPYTMQELRDLGRWDDGLNKAYAKLWNHTPEGT